MKGILNQSQMDLNDGNQSSGTIFPKKNINHSVIRDAVKVGKSMINQKTIGDHTVLLWGYSGTGKSTAIIILSGQEIKSYKKAKPIIIEANPTNNQRGIKIQASFEAGTIYPAFTELKYKKGNQKIILWDMPGIGDNRGATQSLINNYFIHRIFEFHPEVKLVFTINFDQIIPNNKAAGLLDTLIDLTKVLGDVKDYYHAIAIMITKVDPDNDEQEIISFFRQIVVLRPFSQNAQIKFMLSKLIARQIPLILSKQPQLVQKKVPLERAVYVTGQYTGFIQNMYNIVTKELKNALFSKLFSPAMSKSQIKECAQIVQETYRSIEQNIEKIRNQLQKRILFLLESIRISFNEVQFRKGLQSYKQIKDFIAQVTQIVWTKQPDNRKKQQIRTKFKMLMKLFQNYKFCSVINSENKLSICNLMTQLDDNYIMIKFFNKLLFDETEIAIEDQSNIIRQLFKAILSCQFERGLQSYQQKINTEVKTKTKDQLVVFMRSIQNEEFYQEWANQFKVFPALILSTTKFNTSKNLLEFLEAMIRKFYKIGLNTQKIRKIINILELKEAYLTQSRLNQFLNDQIKPVCTEEGERLINKTIEYENWGEADTKNVIYQYQKLNKTLNQFKNTSQRQKALRTQRDQEYKKNEQKFRKQIGQITDSNKKAVIELFNQKKKLEKNIYQKDQTIGELERQNNDLERRIKAKDKQKVSLDNRIDELHKENMRIQRIERVYKTEIKQLKNQVSQKDRQIASLKSQNKILSDNASSQKDKCCTIY